MATPGTKDDGADAPAAIAIDPGRHEYKLAVDKFEPMNRVREL